MNENENSASHAYDLIIIGTSAGGVEALSILVSTLPTPFPAPIVLAQHLDPNSPTLLSQVLQQHTNLPIEMVNASSQLQAGSIYIVPSNRHISIREHYIEVHEGRNKHPRASLDTLFSTAAEAYEERLIAVILTGSGSDGAIGAVDVKNAGGTIIVQDPQSARYPSMPLSLSPTIIDFEVAIEHLGTLLYNLLHGVDITPTEEKTEDTLHEILEQVSRQANMDFHTYKTATILRRIGRRIAVTHCRTMHDYADYLSTNPEEVGELVKAFLINVTQFFRDPEAFNYLREEILPELIAYGREHDHTLRFWTAGCATGEESYSLAMLLTDLLGDERVVWNIKIFATDLDEAAIHFARRGLYSENLLKGVPAEYHKRFFEHTDQGYRISKTLRQMIIFGQQNLSRSAPFPRINLILCRNVLIYFTPELQDYVLNQFAFSLSQDGYLFLGKAETVRPAQSCYELINKHWKIYQCTGKAFPAVRHQTSSEIKASQTGGLLMNNASKKTGKANTEIELLPPIFELSQLKRLNELLLRFLPVGIVIIDRYYRVLTSNIGARRLLGLHDGISEQDFLHAVRGIPYPIIRTAIDTVFREHNVISLPEVELNVVSGGNGRFVSLSIAMMQVENKTLELATISVTDVTDQVQVRRRLEAVQEQQTQLMHEISATNKRLSDVNKELMDANEELQVANEELMLTHEELQASIEEFETTNEELQATNEELETNNEELQATNEELETTNDELRARTNELQGITTILESERVRLAEIVELAPFDILILRGSNLIVEAYNPRYAHLLEGRAVQRQPLADVLDLFWEDNVGKHIIQLAQEVYIKNIIRTLQRVASQPPIIDSVKAKPTTQMPADQYSTYTIVPSHNATGHVDGVIIYAVDETEQRQLETQEELQQLTAIFSNTSSSLLGLYDAQSAKLLIGTPSYLEVLSQVIGTHDLIGKTWQEINQAANDKIQGIWHLVMEQRKPMHIPDVSYTTSDSTTRTTWDYILTPLMKRDSPNKVHFMLVSAAEITKPTNTQK